MATIGEEFFEYLQQSAQQIGQYLQSIFDLSYSSKGPLLIFNQKENGYDPPAPYIHPG